MMPTTSDFILEQIRMRPDITLEELRARAAMEGRRVRTATFYRARVDLGLDVRPTANAESSKPHVEPAHSTEAVSMREAAGPTKSGIAPRHRSDFDGTANDLAKEIEAFLAERDRLREALMRMRAIVQEILVR
jgi:hypothetical protein